MIKIENMVTWCLDKKSNKKVVLFATLILFILSLALFPLQWVKAKMLPGKNANTFTVYVDLPNGNSIAQTKRVTDVIVPILQKETHVTDIEVFLGTPAPLDFAGLVKNSPLKSGEHFAEIVVNLSKKHEREEASFLMVQRLRKDIVKAVQTINTDTTIKMIEPPAGPPVLADVVAQIYGENLQSIEKLSRKVKTLFLNTEGLVDVDILSDDSYEEYQLLLDDEKIKRYGLDINALSKLLNVAFNGEVVSTKNSDQYLSQVDLFLRLKQRDVSIQEALSTLKIRNIKGSLIALNEVVRVKKLENKKTLHSKDLKLMLNVVAQTDMVSQIYPLLEARDYMLTHFDQAYEVKSADALNLEFIDKQSNETLKLVWDGELQVTLNTFRDLGGAFIAALCLIFLLMVVYYKNFALSGIVLLASFLSIIGVIFGHLLVDIITTQTFFLTATSLIGYIALIGISARNALLLIDFTKQQVKEGVNKKEAIIRSATIRSKPIFLTAVSVILASSLLASDAVFGGLGVALIFGTCAAVLASLLVVPVLIDMVSENTLLK